MRSHPILLTCALFALSSPALAQSDTLVEGFEDVTSLTTRGWFLRNNSTVPGENWAQGNGNVFDAQNGVPADYAGVGFESTAGNASGETISNWLITPTLTLTPNSVLSFWTRTVDTPFAPDRLEVRLSTNGASTNVGVSPADTGDFVTTLVTVNPNLSPTGYPALWTQYTISLDRLRNPVTGRIGFRYFVGDGGLFGTNSDYIGLDTVRVQPGVAVAVPEPGTGGMVWLGGVSALVFLRRRR